MKKLVVLIALALLSSGAYAQSKYGADSAECIRNLSLYSELVKQNSLAQAAPYWRRALSLCPQSSENLYINGIRIYKNLLANEKNPNLKQKYIDSIVYLYDQRIEIYNRDKTVSWRKLIDYQQMRPTDYATIFKMAEHCMQVTPEKNRYQVMEIYFRSAVDLYKDNKLGADVVLNAFTTIEDQIEAKAKEGDNEAKATRDNVNNIFVTSGVANCDNLVKLFRPKYESNKKDAAFLKKIVPLLGANQCTADPLYFEAAESLYEIEPMSLSATNLARGFNTAGQFEKAVKYYRLAIKDETSTAVQSALNVELGTILSKQMKQNRDARDCAKEAIRLDATNGRAYFLLGDIYAADKSCVFGDFEKRALYWLIVDCYVKAKQADPALGDTADKFINVYSQYFPTVEDIFFNGFENGAGYTIGCWINERTVIRARR